MNVYVHAHTSALVCACVCAGARACVCVRSRVCVCICVLIIFGHYPMADSLAISDMSRMFVCVRVCARAFVDVCV